ncbi:MAG: putative peroxidase-related enzyme [Planctomycetota bacterium]|jgi:uncharacterized peroxidase-related enzyme
MTTTTQDTRKEELLAGAESKYGFVPNLLRQLSTSTAALELYTQGQATLSAEGSRLSGKERNLVQLTVSEINDCGYCKAAHSAIGRMDGVDSSVLAAVSAGQSIEASEGGDYVAAARLLIEKQGHLSGEDLARLEKQGIDREVLFEIIGSIAIKTVSNWVNHIARTKVDAEFS